MTLKSSDIDNLEHEENPKLKKIVLQGKTTGGAYVEFLVDNNGVLQTA